MVFPRTFAGTLWAQKASAPALPWVPSTMMSAAVLTAVSTMTEAGSPRRTEADTATALIKGRNTLSTISNRPCKTSNYMVELNRFWI